MFKEDSEKYKKYLETKKEDFWLAEGEKKALKLFHSTATRVPAYKKFLKDHGILHSLIKTAADLKKVPTVNKKNYLRKYPFPELCWDGEPGLMDMISVSSGSTGEPFYWLRGHEQEKEAVLTLNAFYQDAFGVGRGSTLFIVSFAMGVWIGGTLIYRATQAIAENHKMTVVTPGINIPEVFKVVKAIGHHYDRIIIAGYPPFVKDMIDQGKDNGINWKKYNIKFLFAAESFSEKWRDYLYKKAGTGDLYKGSLNIYGTADAVIMAHETPLSNLVRRTVTYEKPELYKKIFSKDGRVPTLAQYNPAFKYTEAEDGKLIFSTSSGIPLVRYDLGDTGDVVGYSEMKSILAESGFDMEKEAEKKKINTWQLPFVYVFGRDDFTASLYGMNIYPENIRDGLSADEVSRHVSGKFTMMTMNDEKLNQYLEINIELKKGAKSGPKLEGSVRSSVVRALKQKNTEYNELSKTMGSLIEPKIILREYGDKDFFVPGIKQKWHRS